MLPTPKSDSNNQSSQDTISFLRQSINDNVSTSVPGGNNNNAATKGISSGLSNIFGISVKIANSLEKVVANTGAIVGRLDSLISFFQDQYIRQEQNDESKRLRPGNNQDDRPKNDSNWLLDNVEGLLGNFLIKAAIVGLVSVIEALSGEIQKQAKEMVLGYLVFVRKATINALTSFANSIGNIVADAGKFLGNQILSFLKKIELPALTERELSEFNSLVQTFKKNFSLLVKVFDSISNSKILEYAIDAFNFMFKIVSRTVEVIYKIINVFLRPALSLLESFGSLALKLLGLVKNFLGKVLLPLQILLSLIDFVNGFIAGYEQSGIIEGVKQGLLKVFDGLVIGIINIVRDVVGWIFEQLGLENTAKIFKETINELTQSLTNLLSGIIDLFTGILTLDMKKIWDGLKTGYNSIYDFIVALVSGGVGIVIAFLQDLFGDKIKDALNFIQKDMIKEIVNLITNFKDGVIAWLKDSFKGILEAIPGGKYVSDKIFGNAVATEADVEKEADNIAKQKALSKFSPEDRYNLESTATNPKYTITDEDREEARKKLNINVIVTPPTNPVGNQQADQLKKAQDEKPGKTKENVTTTNNNVVQQINNSSKGTAMVLSRTNNASVSTPMGR